VKLDFYAVKNECQGYVYGTSTPSWLGDFRYPTASSCRARRWIVDDVKRLPAERRLLAHHVIAIAALLLGYERAVTRTRDAPVPAPARLSR
jgi:hypothetical protein